MLSEKQWRGLKESQVGQTDVLDVAYRKGQLGQLIRYLKEHEDGLVQAMMEDFVLESGARLEVMMVLEGARRALGQVQGWMQGERVGTDWSLLHFLDRASIQYDPKGVVLIIGSWNVPLMSLLDPLVGAIAAGCSCVGKPSEIAGQTAGYLGRTLPDYMDPLTFGLVEGDGEATRRLIEAHDWDLIFFTGSERVGRMIYEQAAAKLVPVVLELGGKSPVVVCGDLAGDKLQQAADRIVWAKLVKAGQICIAPDYLLVEEGVYDKFLGCLLNALNRFSGTGQSPDVDLIVSERHWDRLEGLIETGGGRSMFEAYRSRAERYFGPVLISEPDLASPLMTEEVFGPLLVINRVKDVQTAIAFINARPKPLMLYAFSQNPSSIKLVKERTRSGSFMANDLILSFLLDKLPFGGVQASGMGAYHGRHTFLAFSHPKACLERRLNLACADWLIRFPPYTRVRTGRLFAVMFRAGGVLRGLGLVLAFAGAFTALSLALAWAYTHYK